MRSGSLFLLLRDSKIIGMKEISHNSMIACLNCKSEPIVGYLEWLLAKHIKVVYLSSSKVRFFGEFRKRILDPRSFGSRCIRGTEESFPRADLSVPLMHRRPNDLGFGMFQRNAPVVCKVSMKDLTAACLSRDVIAILRNFFALFLSFKQEYYSNFCILLKTFAELSGRGRRIHQCHQDNTFFIRLFTISHEIYLRSTPKGSKNLKKIYQVLRHT